jgi:glycosyltransferase involved in cell wall biosynthesis
MPVTIAPAPAHPTNALLAVGRLAPEKGFDVLIEALTLTRTRPALDLIGDGPMAPALRARADAAGLPVRFLGALPRSEYQAHLRSARALVVPSRREGLGLVAVEAILTGRPVIASAVGGLPSVLGVPGPTVGRVPGGALVPPDDPAALAAALDEVATLGPPGPAALAAAARHEPARVAARHIHVYEEATGGSLRGS